MEGSVRLHTWGPVVTHLSMLQCCTCNNFLLPPSSDQRDLSAGWYREDCAALTIQLHSSLYDRAERYSNALHDHYRERQNNRSTITTNYFMTPMHPNYKKAATLSKSFINPLMTSYIFLFLALCVSATHNLFYFSVTWLDEALFYGAE